MVRHNWTCPTFSKITKYQYLWKALSYFVYLLHEITHLWKLQCYHAVLVWYGPSCNQFTRCFKLNCTSHQVNVLDIVRWSLKLPKYHAILDLTPKYSWLSSLHYFHFWSGWLGNLNTWDPLLQCTCWLIYLTSSTKF